MPKGAHLLQDGGYNGFTLENIAIFRPQKRKMANRFLILSNQLTNGLLVFGFAWNMRLDAFNAFALCKTKFAFRKNLHDSIVDICCGLHNFSLKFYPYNEIRMKTGVFRHQDQGRNEAKTGG